MDRSRSDTDLLYIFGMGLRNFEYRCLELENKIYIFFNYPVEIIKFDGQDPFDWNKSNSF